MPTLQISAIPHQPCSHSATPKLLSFKLPLGRLWPWAFSGGLWSKDAKSTHAHNQNGMTGIPDVVLDLQKTLRSQDVSDGIFS